MISFNVEPAGWTSFGPSFGTLAKCGVLDKHYEPGFSRHDPDDRVLVWTVKVPCIINGKQYAVNDRIEWPK